MTADVNVNASYVTMLAEMVKLVMGAYFAGRTVEKVVEMVQQKYVKSPEKTP